MASEDVAMVSARSHVIFGMAEQLLFRRGNAGNARFDNRAASQTRLEVHVRPRSRRLGEAGETTAAPAGGAWRYAIASNAIQ